MTMTCDDFPSILCDGKTLAITYGDRVYLWENYFLANMNYQISRPFYGNGDFKHYGMIDSELDLSFKIGDPKIINKSDLKIGKDLFNNLTVNELLSIIKSKLKQREN